MSNPRLLLRAGLDAVGRVACARLLQSRTAPIVGADVRLAVPEKCCGLTRILAFFDRCGNCGFASSATGSARPQFPGGPHKTRRAPFETFPRRGKGDRASGGRGGGGNAGDWFPSSVRPFGLTPSPQGEGFHSRLPCHSAQDAMNFRRYSGEFTSHRRREASPDASILDFFRTEHGGIWGCLPTSTRAEARIHTAAPGPFLVGADDSAARCAILCRGEPGDS